MEGYITCLNIQEKSDVYEFIQVDAIPYCHDCLFEIKEGNFICVCCKINLCVIHLNNHRKIFSEHKIRRLNINP